MPAETEEIEDVSLPFVPPEAWQEMLRKAAKEAAIAAEENRQRWFQTLREQAEDNRREHERLQKEAEERWAQRRAEEGRRQDELRKRREANRRKRLARQSEIDEQNRLRKEKHKALEAQFKAAGNRRRWVAIERAKGRTLRSIGEEMGLSAETVRLLQLSHESKARYCSLGWKAQRRNLGRPLDMGGPRDVWIEE